VSDAGTTAAVVERDFVVGQTNMNTPKQLVRDFWEEASCGEALHLTAATKEGYLREADARYLHEPYIRSFADFERAKNKKVLEIGVGLGADHQQFAQSGAILWGIDLTQRAIEHTRKRIALFGLRSHLQVMDAEQLTFEDDFFDMVYSWGVLMVTPDTPRAISEVYRVLKPGGIAKVMIYHKYSFVGYMLWLRYALLRLRPFTSLNRIYDRYLESPGMKAYSVSEAQKLLGDFRNVEITIELTHGDLLTSGAGQRHRGPVLSIARRVWPRRLIRKLFPRHGLYMLISCTKAERSSL
jgi:SAM-dependent methyltransferase